MNVDRITIIPDVCGGEPTIREIQITASQALEMFAGGMKPEESFKIFLTWNKPISMLALSMPRVTRPIAKYL